MNPGGKEDVLKRYNISVTALNEPNLEERKILRNLNKTIEAFYREATFKLDQDFHIYLTMWVYNKDG